MKMQNSLTLQLILLAAAAASPVTRNEWKPNAQKLLLISFDGFRWNYDQDVDTPNMDNLVKEGVKAKYITPPFVTMTSPSHFTTITGKFIPRPFPIYSGLEWAEGAAAQLGSSCRRSQISIFGVAI